MVQFERPLTIFCAGFDLTLTTQGREGSVVAPGKGSGKLGEPEQKREKSSPQTWTDQESGEVYSLQDEEYLEACFVSLSIPHMLMRPGACSGDFY